MKSKFNLKKLLKLAGNLIIIAALVFVVKKIMGMDVKLSDFKSGAVMGSFLINFAVQTGIIIISCFPWLVFTQSLSGKKIPYSAAMPIYTKSNILKYIPGNVFQYVGRNQLALEMKISHVDVACATILDILFCVFWTGVISVVLLGGKIAELLGKYGKNILIIGIAGIILAAALIIFIRLKFKDKLIEFLSRYSKAFKKENRAKLLQGIFYYLVHNAILAASYFVCLRLIIGSSASFYELVALTGAYLFAWIIGFITPGAPGGIGIREGVMIFVCGDEFQDKVVLFVLVMRIASIFADVAAFLTGRIYHRIKINNSAA